MLGADGAGEVGAGRGLPLEVDGPAEELHVLVPGGLQGDFLGLHLGLGPVLLALRHPLLGGLRVGGQPLVGQQAAIGHLRERALPVNPELVGLLVEADGRPLDGELFGDDLGEGDRDRADLAPSRRLGGGIGAEDLELRLAVPLVDQVDRLAGDVGPPGLARGGVLVEFDRAPEADLLDFALARLALCRRRRGESPGRWRMLAQTSSALTSTSGSTGLASAGAWGFGPIAGGTGRARGRAEGVSPSRWREGVT